MKFSPWNERVILTAFAISQAIGITYASMVAETGGAVLAVVAIVKGGLLGLSVSFGLALIVQRLGGVMTSRRRLIGTACAIGIGVISPALILAAFLASAWSFHALSAVALDLACAAVAISSGRLADAPKVSEHVSEPASEPKPTKKPAHILHCSACGFGAKSQNALNAHMRKHAASKDFQELLKTGERLKK